MKDFYKKHFRLPLNIQLFAEGGDGDKGGEGEGEKTKTYSEEEYQKLKVSFDKVSSEIAEMKKKEKAKMSEEEKKKAEDEERNAEIEKMRNQLQDYELKSELANANVFTSEEIDSIIKEKGDLKKMLSTISGLINGKVEQAKKDAKAEFMQSSDVGGTNNGESSEEKEIRELAKMNSRDTGKSKFF